MTSDRLSGLPGVQMPPSPPATARSSGGQAGNRGYLVQTLVALLDVALNETCTTVTIEPDHVSSKFDILWEDSTGQHAIQVKSTSGQFSKSEISSWSFKFKEAAKADDYTLVLVGLMPLAPDKITSSPAVKLEFKNLDLDALNEQAAHRLDKFLRRQSLPSGSAWYREMLAGAIASELAKLASKGVRQSRKELIDKIRSWIKESEPETDNEAADNLLRATRESVADQISESHISLKYDPRWYIRRSLTDDIEKWLSLSGPSRPNCFLILAPAGCGKTNILCDIATRSAEVRPTYLIAGGRLRLHESLGIWGVLGEQLQIADYRNLNRKAIVDKLQMLTRGRFDLLVVIDAINEYFEPGKLKRELCLFLAEAKRVAAIATVISCRDYYWGLFEDPFWEEFVRVPSKPPKLFRRQLGNFTREEAEKAFETYFRMFNIDVKPEGNAWEQFRHPLLLRFFCETHGGMHLGVIRDIRLKDLFDRYWASKLTSIAVRMVDQGDLATIRDLEGHVANCLLTIAGNMLYGNTRALPLEEVLRITNSETPTRRLQGPFGRILDEHIILEELSQTDQRIEVAFVFEEFMEYTMARFLVGEWRDIDESQIAKNIVNLSGRYDAFSQIFGVILYVGLMLKSERNIAIWPALIGLGPTWERVVVEAFKKLPVDQIDDTVFSAIVDLLRLQRPEIQIATLELLKFGRLHRIFPGELIEAIGELALHSKIQIRRRAILALASCTAELAVPYIEKAVKSGPMRRLNDQYVFVRTAFRVLKSFNNYDSIRTIAMISAGYSCAPLDSAKDLPEECFWIARDVFNGTDDLFTKMGVLKVMGASRWRSALSFLEHLAQKPCANPAESWHLDLPAWVDRENLWTLGLVQPRRGAMIAVTQSFARKALKKLENTIQELEASESWIGPLRSSLFAPWNGGLPEEIRSWVTSGENGKQNDQLVKEVIKRGLELRSGKIWSVSLRYCSGFYTVTRIKSSRGRRSGGLMAAEDLRELRQLLSLSDSDHHSNAEDGVYFYDGSSWSDYWKEFIFRAWGEVPVILGKFEFYN